MYAHSCRALHEPRTCTDNTMLPTCPGPKPSVNGTWRLVFGTASKFRPFQYIPINENFVIDMDSSRLALESQLGPFEFFIKGQLYGWDAATGVLDFQFGEVDIHFMGKSVRGRHAVAVGPAVLLLMVAQTTACMHACMCQDAPCWLCELRLVVIWVYAENAQRVRRAHVAMPYARSIGICTHGYACLNDAAPCVSKHVHLARTCCMLCSGLLIRVMVLLRVDQADHSQDKAEDLHLVLHGQRPGSSKEQHRRHGTPEAPVNARPGLGQYCFASGAGS
jgi:hypothetical protein